MAALSASGVANLVDRQFQDPRQRIERLGIERVGDGDEEFDPIHLERQDILALGLFATDELEQFLGRSDLGHVHDFHVELQAQSLGDGRPGDLTALDQLGQGQGIGVLAIRGRPQLGANLGHGGGGHEPLVLNELDDEIVGGRHSGKSGRKLGGGRSNLGQGMTGNETVNPATLAATEKSAKNGLTRGAEPANQSLDLGIEEGHVAIVENNPMGTLNLLKHRQLRLHPLPGLLRTQASFFQTL